MYKSSKPRSREMQNEESDAMHFLAGFLTGRGGFDEKDGRAWLFLLTLDHEVVAEAVALWGGRITGRDYYDTGRTLWKWTITNAAALAALKDLAPYLRGYKRDKAEDLLKRFERVAA
jgi:hypothetical protein